MVPHSKLFLALLTSVATMAFWLGMWSNSVSTVVNLPSPKPYHSYPMMLNFSTSPRVTSQESPLEDTKPYEIDPRRTTSSSFKSVRMKMTTIQTDDVNEKTAAKAKFKKQFSRFSGNPSSKRVPSIAKALFSFASLRPGAKRNPFDYGAKLIGYRLALEQGNHQNLFSMKPPKALVEIPPIKANWKIAPQYAISDDIPVQSARNVLILTSWRSGSTFLGDLLNHYPGTFYSFEPIHYLSNTKRKAGDKFSQDAPDEALNLLRDIYNCDFKSNLSMAYLKHTSLPENQFLLKHNFRIWNACSTLLPVSSACFMPEFEAKSCQKFPVRLIKTVRLRAPYIEGLFKDPKLNLKVIVLVRDPRGVMRSRSEMSWCDQPMCNNITSVCKDLHRDVAEALRLGAEYQDRITMVRYEDLSTSPYKTMDKLINFLGLPSMPEFMDKYLESHTGKYRFPATEEAKVQVEEEGPYGTKRESSEKTAFKWTHYLDKEFIKDIEETCIEPMTTLGYKSYQEHSSIEDILGKTSSEVWPY